MHVRDIATSDKCKTCIYYHNGCTGIGVLEGCFDYVEDKPFTPDEHVAEHKCDHCGKMCGNGLDDVMVKMFESKAAYDKDGKCTKVDNKKHLYYCGNCATELFSKWINNLTHA